MAMGKAVLLKKALNVPWPCEAGPLEAPGRSGFRLDVP